jgi:hypothetical protein
LKLYVDIPNGYTLGKKLPDGTLISIDLQLTIPEHIIKFEFSDFKCIYDVL